MRVIEASVRKGRQEGIEVAAAQVRGGRGIGLCCDAMCTVSWTVSCTAAQQELSSAPSKSRSAACLPCITPARTGHVHGSLAWSLLRERGFSWSQGASSPCSSFLPRVCGRCLPQGAAAPCAPITLRQSLCANHCVPITVRQSLCANHCAPIIVRQSLCANHCVPAPCASAWPRAADRTPVLPRLLLVFCQEGEAQGTHQSQFACPQYVHTNAHIHTFLCTHAHKHA